LLQQPLLVGDDDGRVVGEGDDPEAQVRRLGSFGAGPGGAGADQARPAQQRGGAADEAASRQLVSGGGGGFDGAGGAAVSVHVDRCTRAAVSVAFPSNTMIVNLRRRTDDRTETDP